MRAARLAIGFVLFATLPLGSWAQTYSSTAPVPTPQLTVGQRADIFLARRNYPAAIALLNQAVKERQADAAIYNRLGIAYQQLQDLGKAQKYYKQAIKRDKKQGRYRNNLGTVYYMKRNFNGARKQFQQAVKLDPGEATYWVNLGGAEFAMKKFQPAISAYRQALLINPNSLFPATGSDSPVVSDVMGTDTPRFHYDLSRLFCTLGMVDNALHQFRQAYEMHYRDIKKSLTDPGFAPLRLRPEYRVLMGLPPLPPQAGTPHADAE
jgi:tetratricopeptide (TPR) repeat protein